VKIPGFLIRSGKPSRADVTSVIHARQRHPRTAGFQLNDIAGFEGSCHSSISKSAAFTARCEKQAKQGLKRRAFALR
jgi:hypothetical protein